MAHKAETNGRSPLTLFSTTDALVLLHHPPLLWAIQGKGGAKEDGKALRRSLYMSQYASGSLGNGR